MNEFSYGALVTATAAVINSEDGDLWLGTWIVVSEKFDAAPRSLEMKPSYWCAKGSRDGVWTRIFHADELETAEQRA